MWLKSPTEAAKTVETLVLVCLAHGYETESRLCSDNVWQVKIYKLSSRVLLVEEFLRGVFYA